MTLDSQMLIVARKRPGHCNSVPYWKKTQGLELNKFGVKFKLVLIIHPFWIQILSLVTWGWLYLECILWGLEIIYAKCLAHGKHLLNGIQFYQRDTRKGTEFNPNSNIYTLQFCQTWHTREYSQDPHMLCRVIPEEPCEEQCSWDPGYQGGSCGKMCVSQSFCLGTAEHGDSRISMEEPSG